MRRLMILGLLALTSLGYSCCGDSGEGFPLDYKIENEPEFYVFVSLSMPKSTLKEISNHIEKIGGTFVFRGFPKGSFSEFLKEVVALRALDINAHITIDPDLFEDYSVTAVPTFVYLPSPKKSEAIGRAEELSRASEDTPSLEYKKVVGNVSVPWALREMGVEL